MKQLSLIITALFITVVSYSQVGKFTIAKQQGFTATSWNISVSNDSILHLDSLALIKKIFIKDEPAIILTVKQYQSMILGFRDALHNELKGKEADPAIDIFNKYFGVKQN